MLIIIICVIYKQIILVLFYLVLKSYGRNEYSKFITERNIVFIDINFVSVTFC
jgi:hypothetical protein